MKTFDRVPTPPAEAMVTNVPSIVFFIQEGKKIKVAS